MDIEKIGGKVPGFTGTAMNVQTGNQAAPASTWTASHLPAANVQATIAKAAAGAGVRNVFTALTVVFAAGATAPAAVNTSVSLIDGVSGGTTYLWRSTISLPATAGAMNGIALTDLWLVGTANTALTLEFLAAGGLNTFESVTMSGITISD